MPHAYRAPPEIARPAIGMPGLLTTPSEARFCSTHPRPRPARAGSKSERAMPRPSPGLWLVCSSGHWGTLVRRATASKSILSSPGYTSALARARVRSHLRARPPISGAKDLGTLRQIRGACRLCGTHQRHRRLVGVDQIPDVCHVQTQLVRQSQHTQLRVGRLGRRTVDAFIQGANRVEIGRAHV